MSDKNESSRLDPLVRQIKAALESKLAGHSIHADVVVEPHEGKTPKDDMIDVRVLSDDFKSIDMVDREKLVWDILEADVDDEAFFKIVSCIIQTPAEHEEMENAFRLGAGQWY